VNFSLPVPQKQTPPLVPAGNVPRRAPWSVTFWVFEVVFVIVISCLEPVHLPCTGPDQTAFNESGLKTVPPFLSLILLLGSVDVSASLEKLALAVGATA
jgi:hypothetical protein